MSSANPWPDLWARYRGGDAAAFDLVYAEFRGPLFRYIRRQCGNCAESEELYQDVWLRAIRARDQFQGEYFKAWLFRIAHNRLIDFHRARGNADDYIDELGEQIADEVEAARPEGWSFLRDCVERLFALLKGLPQAQRNAFLLKEETGLSLAEIAEVTATSRETVKSRLRYATRQLRVGMEGCDD